MSPATATYFAAIPGNNGFDSKGHCGDCVQITGQNGTMIIATIIDECPYGNDGGNTICGGNPKATSISARARSIAWATPSATRAAPTGVTSPAP